MNKIGQEQAKDILTAIIKNNGFIICQYAADTDTFILYNDQMDVEQEVTGYLENLENNSIIYPEDRQKIRDLYAGEISGPQKIRLNRAGGTARMLVQILEIGGKKRDENGRISILVTDITKEMTEVEDLQERAARDALTSLYNYSYGRKLISEYLNNKDPYATCGMMVMDIDYFKYVNDTYGHLFGDHVLVRLANLLRHIFEDKDVVMRCGGDEFVIFLKDISHSDLVKRGMQLVNEVRNLKFENRKYSMTCSVGICYLQENESGYTYDQVFGNADWALYQAKERGRDRYVFCDHLRRFEMAKVNPDSVTAMDVRYMHNDIISTAFEIFEKMNSFTAAIEQLLEIIGSRFRLDRITIIRTDIQEKNTERLYQWTSEYAPEVLKEKSDFSKEDFMTLFRSYDEHQTVVLQYDDMSMYSPGGAALLMQGDAKTVVYAAMYCEGKYTGAISYVTCREKRYWTRETRKELGEVTKIISAHLSRKLAINESRKDPLDWSEYDSLTGLSSFMKFRTELERLIIGKYVVSEYLIYMDFVGFKYFNQKYGYSRGDQILKEFSSYVIGKIEDHEGVYFTRVVSDQFLLLLPCRNGRDIFDELRRIGEGFNRLEGEKIKGYQPRLRMGVYQIDKNCTGVSFAIDAANYARKQILIKTGSPVSVRLYDEELQRKQMLENEIVNEIGEAVKEKRFQLFLQPKVSLKDRTVIGAEALVRWQTRDGKMISPNQFISLCESTGQIEELDFYVFEQTVKFLAENRKKGRRQLPVSVNISIHHALDSGAAQRFRSILDRYGVDTRYMEIELTETATVKEYEDAKRLFRELQAAGMRTAIDDFGAGYSVLNSIIDIPVNTMKLDGIFIRNCTASEHGIFLLQSVVEMIRGLGYHVVCEGVETEKQEVILRKIGCEAAQGFLFSRPLPIEEYEKYVYGDR